MVNIIHMPISYVVFPSSNYQTITVTLGEILIEIIITTAGCRRLVRERCFEIDTDKQINSINIFKNTF